MRIVQRSKLNQMARDMDAKSLSQANEWLTTVARNIIKDDDRYRKVCNAVSDYKHKIVDAYEFGTRLAWGLGYQAISEEEEDICPL